MIKLWKLLKNVEILSSNMFRVRVKVRRWECRTEVEAERKVEHDGSDLCEAVNSTEGGDKSVQNS